MKRSFLPLLVIVMFALTGCTEVALEGVKQMHKVSDRLSKRIAKAMGGDEQKPDDPLYCYKTLAKPVCYDQPIPGEGHRLIAYYGPKPVASAVNPTTNSQ